MSAALEERFWSKVDKTDDCWVWVAAKTGGGYGYIGVAGGKIARAHRISYEWAKGPIPEGLFVCHTCDNRACVNPEHLFVGTHSDNMKDMMAKGRKHKPFKSSCKHGHEYTPENTYYNTRGHKCCHTCMKGRRNVSR